MRWFRIRKAKIAPDLRQTLEQHGIGTMQTQLAAPDRLLVYRGQSASADGTFEVFEAHRLGGDMVKVFPVQSVGGAAYLRALRGPFPDLSQRMRWHGATATRSGRSRSSFWRWGSVTTRSVFPASGPRRGR